jgi:hypothetical protein
MNYNGDDQNCEFFVYRTPCYELVILHNSIAYSFEDAFVYEGDESWICEELEGIWLDEIDCWID